MRGEFPIEVPRARAVRLPQTAHSDPSGVHARKRSDLGINQRIVNALASVDESRANKIELQIIGWGFVIFIGWQVYNYFSPAGVAYRQCVQEAKALSRRYVATQLANCVGAVACEAVMESNYDRDVTMPKQAIAHCMEKRGFAAPD